MKQGWAVVAVLFLAGLFRFAYLGDIDDLPTRWAPQNDPSAYLTQARHLADVDPWGGDAPYFKAPFYPYTLAAFHKLGLDPLRWIPWVQSLLGLASVAVGAALARRWGAGTTGTLVTAVILGLSGVFPYFEGEVLTTAWIVFLDLAGLLLLSRAGQSPVRMLGAGAVFGLSAVARPTVIVFCVGVALYLALRRSRRSAVAFAIGLGLLILPVTARNLFVGGDRVLISHQGGIAFYTGNNSASDGWSGSPAGFQIIGGNWEYFDCVRRAEAAEGHSLAPSEVSRHYFVQGLEFWRDDFGGALRLLGRKAWLHIGRHRVSNNQDIEAALTAAVGDRWYRFLFDSRFDALLWALGIAGLVAMGRRGRLPAAFVVVYSVTVVAFFVSARYRMPVLAVLAPAAGIFVEQLSRGVRPVAVAVGLLVGFVSLSSPRILVRGSQSGFARAVALMELGRDSEATVALEDVLAEDPQYPRARLNLGVLAMRREDPDAALSAFRAELASNPGDALAANNIGVIHLQDGNLVRAAEWFARSVELQPNHVRAYRNLAAALVDAGHPSAALEALERCMEILETEVEYRPDEVGVRSDRAALLARLGRMDDAVRAYEEAIALNPSRIESRVGLGSVLGRMGRLEDARKILETAVGEVPPHLAAHVDLGHVMAALGDGRAAARLYRRAALIDPERPEPLAALGALLVVEGRLGEARDLFLQALSLDPGFEPARRALDAIEQ